MRQLLRRNAFARIAHAEHDFIAIGHGRHADLAIGRGELDGIADQVRQHLKQTLRVGVDLQVGLGVEGQFHRLVQRQRRQQRERFFEDLRHVQRLRVDGVAPGFDLGGVEQVFQQHVHAAAGLLHGVDGRGDTARGVRAVAAEGFLHHAAEHRNDGHGAAQVVGDHGHQLVAGTHGLLLAQHLTGEVVFQCRTAQVIGGEQVAMAPFAGNTVHFDLPQLKRRARAQAQPRGAGLQIERLFRVAAPRDAFLHLFAKPQHRVVHRLGQGHGQQAAGDVLVPGGGRIDR